MEFAIGNFAYICSIVPVSSRIFRVGCLVAVKNFKDLQYVLDGSDVVVDLQEFQFKDGRDMTSRIWWSLLDIGWLVAITVVNIRACFRQEDSDVLIVTDDLLRLAPTLANFW